MKQVETNAQNIENQSIEINPIKINNILGTMPPAWYPPFFTPKNLEAKNITNDSLFFGYAGSQTNTLDKFQIINLSHKDLTFRTQDGSLLMVQEAKNEKGDWQPIEYWQWDWGMENVIFETLTLQPNKNLNFVAPKYSGTFKTQMRFKLKVSETNDNKQFYYSDNFEVSVNPSQFQLNSQKVKGNAEVWK